MERYEAYKDSGVEWIGEIPEGWRIAPLNSLCTISGGATPSKNKLEYWEGEIPWVSSQEVKLAHLQDTTFHITKDAINSCSTDVYPAGSIVVVVRSGILKHTLPAAMIDVPMSINQDIKALGFKDVTTARFFLHYVFGLNDSLLRHLSKEGATVDNLDVHLFTRCPVVCPPIEEQERIVAYLDVKTAGIDALVADCEWEVELLQEYRRAVISEAVTKGLDPDAPMKDSGIEWIGEIPETWNIAKLKTCCDILPGYAFKSELFIQDGDSVKLLRGINLGVNSIRWDEVVSYPPSELEELGAYRLLPGDVVIGLDRPWIKEGLRIAIVQHEGFKQYLVQRVARMRGSSDLDVRYVKYALESGLLECELDSLTTGVSVPHISTEQIGATRIALPCITTQREIIAQLDDKTAEIDSLIDAKQTMADKLREYRRSLISEAVTGKFKVPGV